MPALLGVGVYVFAVTVWITVWLMWIVFTRAGRVIDQAGQTVGRVGGTLGFVGAGRTDDAARAAKYGPMSVVSREGFKQTSKRAGNTKQRVRDAGGRAKERGSQMKDVVTQQVQDVWGGEDGSRD